MTDQQGITLAQWHERYEALRDFLECYAGLPADDTAGEPSVALAGYLAAVAFDAPGQPALVAAQLRLLMETERVASVFGGDDAADPEAAGLPWPVVADRPAWLAAVAGHLEAAATSAAARTGAPATPWAWRRCFPMLHQLFGGYFGQDFPDEYAEREVADAEADALAAWSADVSPAVRARTVGELHELVALHLDRVDLEPALTALALDFQPDPDPAAWLDRLTTALVDPHL